MYGTVARLKLKPGMEERFNQELKNFEDYNVDGYLGASIYKLDDFPNEYYMVVAFRDKDSYFKNANSPEQDQRYRQMMEFLDGEPRWHDGEVIYSGPWNSQ